MLSAVRVPASTATATATVIMIHGLGDSGNGWKFLADMAHSSPRFKNVRFVFPNAPEIPITVNGGMKMPGWFDIAEFGKESNTDAEGFINSCGVIQDLIQYELDHGIKGEKIIVGGFSQGAALALATGALSDVKLGGIVGLSGFVPCKEKVQELAKNTNFATPIFMGHGDADPVISHRYGQLTSEFYKQLGFKDLDFKTYPHQGHTAGDEELADLFEFLGKIV
ncbi:unnamed protein product [Kuraishia capsulata CBS 1993]|uniref:Acyl-protein thioesterase 1 n=1 Tax=Kuraishia capsulata CBS 1993 TaxID=1382522 RepID=W6MFJ2_9ASCO|nr:uncharacterized protein KUCA_T00000073001 [Kuraishia capsulata CBS 1993]CDK24113.1 unnamed protein product [Kuraishia capsulata CBS 1993]